MAITKAKKVQLLDTLKGMVTGAVSIVFVHFKGLTTKETNEVRDALKKEGVRFSVVKKTLLKRTLADAGVTGELPELTGEVAIAYLPKGAGDDASVTARGLNEFVKKFKTKLVFLGGVMEGAFLSKGDTEMYAAIPSTQILRGMFANVINSPIQRIAIALGEVAKIK